MKNLIEGLQILSKYYNNLNDCRISAAHDTIYISTTDNEIPESDVNKLIELGWFQDVYFGDKFTYGDYEYNKSWVLFVY